MKIDQLLWKNQPCHKGPSDLSPYKTLPGPAAPKFERGNTCSAYSPFYVCTEQHWNKCYKQVLKIRAFVNWPILPSCIQLCYLCRRIRLRALDMHDVAYSQRAVKAALALPYSSYLRFGQSNILLLICKKIYYSENHDTA